MNYAEAFRAYVGRQFGLHSPRLPDWLRSLPLSDLEDVHHLCAHCLAGEGQPQQEERWAALVSSHHYRQTREVLSDESPMEVWGAAAEEVFKLVRMEGYRRKGLDPDLMTGLFR